MNEPLRNPRILAPLSRDLLEKMDAYWRAANYLSVGQIYLQDNPLLETPLTLEHIKPRLLGHWGTTTGLNFIYVHLNRLIKENDLNMIYVIGPGHGGPGLVAQSYLEGSYTERYPSIERSRNGLQRLFRQFSWPYGIPSHVAPETPGSIHEGGELGYSLVHAYGAAFDNPDLIVTCIIGDGEAETGALATSWHSNKFLNPARDGAVLPILHLNGFKIANPTVLARISRRELTDLIRGYGYEPHFVEGDVPADVHQALAGTLDKIIAEIHKIQRAARSSPGTVERPRWPMIVFRTPKGWTGPKFVDGKPVEGTWRAHQVPIADLKNPAQLKQLENWMKSYRPHELFDERGTCADRPSPHELAAHIGVTTNTGVVTLMGHVETYTQKIAAERAAWRVKGVKAVAEEIEGRLQFSIKRGDEEIASAAVSRLAWNVSVVEY
jgi:xylulose-5-phosphate/fructose-6-phosphate phosphoketolase